MTLRFLAVTTAFLFPLQTVDIRTVLNNATDYVEWYEPALGLVIAEEEYDQRVPLTDLAFRAGGIRSGGLAPRGGNGRSGLSLRARQEFHEQRTKADFLMMRLPTGDNQWVGFRVVVEVDGREVRDRMDRVLEVLTRPTVSAIAQWRAMADESARFNLGDVLRSTNVPTFALVVLHREHRDRFEFEYVDDDWIEGRRVWVLEFEEVRGPTLIIDPITGINVPTHGRLWVDPTDGLIARSEIRTGHSEGELESEITVRYHSQTHLGVWVPRDMRESYKSRGQDVFEGHARYSDYQRYGVSVEEEVPMDDQESPRSGH
tara:strand:- start:768 stop:1715 length:948 start_codon:yes stop_codon:yes gene_type:complete